jgi:hypothetical protein
MTHLRFKHILTMILWAIFRPHKILVMKHWEDKGMVDLFAFGRAKKATKEDYIKLKDAR